MENLTLIGMPGSGKSTVGVRLAKTLGYGFLDTDLVLQQREGTLLQDLLNQRGVSAFLDAEEAAIRSVTCTRTVIAPGGSAVCREAAIGHLKQLGLVYYLKVEPQELERRLTNMDSRGIAMERGQTLFDVYRLRASLYEKNADRIIPVENRSLEATVSLVAHTFLLGAAQR